MGKLENAVQWMINLANDDSHGYDQAHRWGPNYDCASAVISAWEQAGVPVKTNGASYTGDMADAFLRTGFTNVISQVDLASGNGLKRGDVLLKPHSHTAMYIGNSQLVHASINEFGETEGGQSGDQTGKEICIASYYNKPWSYVLRYTSEASEDYLQKGDQGQAVLDMQKKLIACGYSCGASGADGSFGTDTENAVKAFQRDYGLAVDGIFGEATKKKLEEVYAEIDGRIIISNDSEGMTVCGDNVAICEKPGDMSTFVGYLKNGSPIPCDFRIWKNNICYFHFQEGYVDGRYLRGWIQEEGKWWYLLGTGKWEYPKNTFYEIEDNVYYFDEEGWMVTGWRQINGVWYYMRSWGAIFRNEFFKDETGNLFYANADGSMFTGWMEKNGKKYYFRDWGAAFQNEKFEDPNTGEIYYGTSDGSIIMNSWVQIDGKYYYFGETGAAYRDKLFTEGQDKYYCDKDGVMLTNAWKEIDGAWYYFRDWGGALNIGLWSDGENTYYFGTDCKMKTGWITVGNTTYFFRDWGAMLKHAWIKTNDVWKYVDKNGVYVPSKDTTNQPDTSDGSITYTGKV